MVMMVANLPADVRRRRDELVIRVQRTDDALAVFAEASTRLRQLVPFDAALWMTTDPATGLPTAPTRIENLDDQPEHCSRAWRREFLGGDVNLFRDLARADQPASALRVAAQDPLHSARYRDLLRPSGFDDELRAVLRAGDSPWGAIWLFRNHGQRAFTHREVGLVASLSTPLGEALRVRARPTTTPDSPVPHSHPGLLRFDAAGALISANDQARAWLAELPPCGLNFPSDLGLMMPSWVMGVVFRASAAGGRGDATARARVHTPRGPWLTCHASCLWDADGSLDQIAVVIEPATAAEIAPIIIQAYDLSDREQQIIRLLARGASTTDISQALFVSPHTVRSHIKAVFGKVGVASRGELVAKLFAEHYEPVHTADVTRVHDN
jgi:DNA-binding CsgD family transcriptional regulator